MNEEKRIEQLRRELHRHNHLYYVENSPEISDREFDTLMHELQDLEAKHPEMHDPTPRSAWEAILTWNLPVFPTAIPCCRLPIPITART